MYDEPAPTTATTTAATTTATSTTVTTAAVSTPPTSNLVNKGKDNQVESADSVLNQSGVLEELAPRKRTRVVIFNHKIYFYTVPIFNNKTFQFQTRLQLKLDEQDDFDEELGEDEAFESSESDDNWELPQSSKKRARKETTPKSLKLPKRSSGKKNKASLEK